jgi:hypothetical protein
LQSETKKKHQCTNFIQQTKTNMQIIDINIEEVKTAYKKDRKIKLENIDFYIGKLCGTINEFLLFNKGKQYRVYEDAKQKIAFIIIN